IAHPTDEKRRFQIHYILLAQTTEVNFSCTERVVARLPQECRRRTPLCKTDCKYSACKRTTKKDQL
ncbi:MAG: hypothetical protein ACRCZO_14570, partial [Cetobacterium sp.]